MEINEQNLTQLRGLFLQTLLPDNNARKEAERFLSTIEVQPGFSIVLLHLISMLSGAGAQEDLSIRQSASVLFKNLVKRRWQPADDESVAIPDGDRATIKAHLVELMLSTPPAVQKQLAEAVSIVAKYDFPAKWEGLLPQLVQKLTSGDLHIMKGVMLTINSITKRYRFCHKTDPIMLELIYWLQNFAAPLMEAYLSNAARIAGLGGDKAQLLVAFEAQRLMTRIYFSLNWLDLPEFFEDNISTWMTEFGKFLTYTNPLLVDSNENDEPGAIEKLQAAIVENLNLYATKYEDEFAPFLPQFTKCIWELLLKVGSQPKYDVLATSAIKFLTSVSAKQMNVGLFTDDVLREIVEHIVVKNLTATEADEELFEDNPTDYIRKDMEGTDQDTRRRSACELVRGLLKFFNVKVSQLCVAYITHMLEQYRSTMNWKAKDAALHLVLAVAVMSTSANMGAGELNPNVNLLEIFNSHVLPEIHDLDVNARPIVKADAIKMICVFRTHLQAPFLLALLPHIIRHLNSKYVVVQTYAALCIERFLTVKDRDPLVAGVTTNRITKEHLTEHLQSLFAGLFNVLENPDIPENDYTMKCIMRVLSVLGSDIAPVTSLVLQHLTAALDRVCKNPVNPHFNHYLFECLAVLVRSCCGTGKGITTNGTGNADSTVAATCAQFEALLFPPFQAVLQQDVTEFVPYVFQILAQLLSARPGTQPGLSPPYQALFPPLLSPTLWERKGNVPALTDLFRAYISKGAAHIVATNSLQGVLGVFQKLLASKTTDMYAFKLLDSLFSHCQLADLAPFVNTVWNLLLHRMQELMKDTKTPRYCRSFLHSLCLYAARYGGAATHEALAAIDGGLLKMIIMQVWTYNRASCAAADPHEVKHMTVGATRLLCESPVAQDPESFSSLVKSAVSLVQGERSDRPGTEDLETFLDEEADAREFDSSYSKLAFALVEDGDATAEIPSAPKYLVTSLSSLSRTRPGSYGPMVRSALDDSEAKTLQDLFSQTGVTIE